MNDSTKRKSRVPTMIQMVGALPTRDSGERGGVLLSRASFASGVRVTMGAEMR